VPSRPRTVDVLSLETLTVGQVKEYLERRFSAAGLAAEIAPRLEERSGGNPLFLEAMTNLVITQMRKLGTLKRSGCRFSRCMAA